MPEHGFAASHVDRAPVTARAAKSPVRERGVVDAIEAEVRRTSGGGTGLPEDVRDEMEPRIGHDLSRIRIHDDASADRLTRSVGARAFAVGSDLYFRSGAFRPRLEVGRRLLAHEVVHTIQHRPGGPVLARQTVEERRLSQPALGSLRNVFAAQVSAFRRALARAAGFNQARSVVRSHGSALWTAATARARGPRANTDDRPLYWARLQMTRAIRVWAQGGRVTTVQRNILVQELEEFSRGQSTNRLRSAPKGTRQILISGFDPFYLNQDVRMGNPSGAAVLALDGTTVTAGNRTARIQGTIFPVRYRDFDRGMVERFFSRFLGSVDMIMTISMGGRTFDLEADAGRRRSAGTFPDNMGQVTTGTRSHPKVPPSRGGHPYGGPELIHSTLPRAAMARGLPQVRLHSAAVVRHGRAVEGSGGGFLSNEVSYRSIWLVHQHARHNVIRVGHLHVPGIALPRDPANLRGFLRNVQNEAQMANLRDQIVRTVRRLIEAALPTLP